MSTSRTIATFLATLLLPFVVVAAGAGIAALGLWLGWLWMAIAGGIIVLAGIAIGGFLFLAADAV